MARTWIKLKQDIPYVPDEFGMVKDAEFTLLKRVKYLGVITTSAIVRAANGRTFKIEKKYWEEI